MSKLITPSAITATVKYPSIVEEFIEAMSLEDLDFEFKPKNTDIIGRSSFSFGEYQIQQNERFNLNYGNEGGHWFEFKNRAKHLNCIKSQYLSNVNIREFSVLNSTGDAIEERPSQYILTIKESPFSEKTYLIGRCSINIIEKLIVNEIYKNKKMDNASLEELAFDNVPLEKGVEKVEGSFVIEGAELKNSIHGKKLFTFSVRQADIFE